MLLRRVVCILFLATFFFAGLAGAGAAPSAKPAAKTENPETAAERKERLKKCVKKMENGDVIVPLVKNCPEHVKRTLGARHDFIFDLWVPYMIYLDPKIDWQSFADFEEVPSLDVAVDKDLKTVHAFLKKHCKVSHRASKKASVRSLTRLIDSGFPMLVRTNKFVPECEALIKRRTGLRGGKKTPEEREKLFSRYKFDMAKSYTKDGHHPRYLVGYNSETMEFCVMVDEKNTIWYT